MGAGFHNNQAAENGGAIFLNHTTSTIIEETKFDQNIAELSGGAVNGINCAYFKMSNGSFHNNSAGVTGGAINMKVGHHQIIRGATRA